MNTCISQNSDIHFSENTEIMTWTNVSLFASEADRRPLMGSYLSLTFAYFKPFPVLKYTIGPDWSKKFVKPMNIDFAWKLYGS